MEIRTADPYPPTIQIKATRYKAKVGTVSPLSRRGEFEKQDSCFLGISLENPSFTEPKLAAIARWMARRFSRCTVLIGDSIHRITLETTRSLRGEAALAEALRLGREFVGTHGHVFNEHGDGTEFDFLTCAEVQSWPDYPAYHRYLLEQFHTDTPFQESVTRFAQDYHGKHASHVDAAELELRVGRSCQYFLEEFAVFACLRRRGLSVMVYPGSFSTLAEVASEVHPKALPELKSMTVVALQLKGRAA